jgi:hypothetical protein
MEKQMSHDIEGGAARKEMILTYASRLDYEGMAGQATDLPAWSPEGFAAMGLFKEAFKRQLDESGESIEARALAAPLHTRRLGVQSSLPFVIDGPYAEARDVLAGYWIVECDRFGPATKLLAGLRAARHQNMSSPTGMPTCGRLWKSAAEVSVSDEGR